MNHQRWLLTVMFASVILVGVAMFLDEQSEFERDLKDLQKEQNALVTAVAADFEARLLRAGDITGQLSEQVAASRTARLLGGAIELNQEGSRLLLVAVPGIPGFFRTDGKRIESPRLAAAFERRQEKITFGRGEASQLGLPPRMAVAGLRRVANRGQGWGIAVVASAEGLRDREQHAQLRFLLGLSVVTLLVAGFGGLALRDQRRRLEVARELEVAALRRESERLLSKADKLATLAALSSGIAHQIATPLGTIVARVEQVLPAVANTPKATLALQVVADQVARIQRIISGVLDLARGNRPTLIKTAPAVIVHSALNLVQHRLAEASMRTKLELEPGLETIACDPPMLEQALVNLLLNASEASAPGSTISIALQATAGAVRFVVEDEGEGISDETAARAGEPFFTTKSSAQGTGLGLAIAQEVVANHGGKLSLQRREGQRGTRAVIEIPT